MCSGRQIPVCLAMFDASGSGADSTSSPRFRSEAEVATAVMSGLRVVVPYG